MRGVCLDRAENLRKWHLSRRRFLQMAGLAGAAGVAAVSLPRLAHASRVLAAEDASAEDRSDGEPGRRIRQWMMIIDLRYCDGCQSQDTPPSCTQACNYGHFAPEPMEWIEVYEHELAGDRVNADLIREEFHTAFEGTRFVPTPCMQCQNPPCVNVCPVGATWSTPEGVVLIDQNRCIGCRMCMAACPYERRFFTWGKPSIPVEAMFVEKSPEHQVAAQIGVVYKCDFCPEMPRAGRLPFCIQACPQHALYYGDLEEDRATNGREVVSVSRFLANNSAFRLKEELGTRPRVYYIPGHGELTGRDPLTRGRLPTQWKYKQLQDGATTWERSEA